MRKLPNPIAAVIKEFNLLPGIGHKTSERFVFFLLKQHRSVLERFAQSLLAMNQKIIHCSVCYNFAEMDPCEICSDSKRDHTIVCVVSESTDVLALEKANVFRGLYHVLGGTINQIEGIGPERLHVAELIQRVEKTNVQEIILALNPDVEGESSSLYIANVLEPLGVKITRLARGLPTGSNIEYADELTLQNALEGRREL